MRIAMTTKSSKQPPRELDDIDRTRIGAARDVLKEYGQYVDVAEMSDVAYEKRVCRMKALDTVVGVAQYAPPHTKWVELAKIFEQYIWEGDSGAVRDGVDDDGPGDH
jgi:hypothetical protein